MKGTVIARLPGGRVIVQTVAAGDVRADARGVTMPPLGLKVTVEKIGETWVVVTQGGFS